MTAPSDDVAAVRPSPDVDAAQARRYLADHEAGTPVAVTPDYLAALLRAALTLLPTDGARRGRAAIVQRAHRASGDDAAFVCECWITQSEQRACPICAVTRRALDHFAPPAAPPTRRDPA